MPQALGKVGESGSGSCPYPNKTSSTFAASSTFADASRLATNVDKRVITPIRYSQPQMEAMHVVFWCKIQDFPIKYLGAPLSISKISRSEEQHLVDSVAFRIPTWKSGLLTNIGRATLTKTTLPAILVHVSIYCYLSPWAIDQID